MKSFWRIGPIAGIDAHLHFTFLLLLGWVVLAPLPNALQSLARVQVETLCPSA